MDRNARGWQVGRIWWTCLPPPEVVQGAWTGLESACVFLCCITAGRLVSIIPSLDSGNLSVYGQAEARENTHRLPVRPIFFSGTNQAYDMLLANEDGCSPSTLLAYYLPNAAITTRVFVPAGVVVYSYVQVLVSKMKQLLYYLVLYYYSSSATTACAVAQPYSNTAIRGGKKCD